MIKRKMLSHEFLVRVRYADTDQMGMVYYGNYARYYEIGRVELMRSIGLSYADFEKNLGVIMPVTAMRIRYLRPALYDEMIRIKTSLRKLPQRDFHFYTEIFDSNNKLLNAADVTLCFLDAKNRNRIETPKALVDAMVAHWPK